jgi:hypothetical protein
MVGRLHKFIARSPRYVLRPQDRNSMRFSLENTHGFGGIESTFLINLSETGVAFLVEPGQQPLMGDRIKVELPVPGTENEQIAWWATVRRIENYEPTSWYIGNRANPFLENPKILVALHFEQLPEGHARLIRRGLKQSFLQAMREQRYHNWAYYRTLWLGTGLRFVLYALLTAAAFGFIYWFSLPDAKYDAKRGTPWGDRYKF